MDSCGSFVAKILPFSLVLMSLKFSLQSDCSAALSTTNSQTDIPQIQVFKLVTLQVLSYSVQMYCLFVFVDTKENVCIYGISSDTVFNNSVIAICKLFHGTSSSQQEEQFER